MGKSQKLQFVKHFNFATGNFRAILTDYGLSTVVVEGSEHTYSVCGTPLYSSPQLLRQKGYSYKVDIWALGIATYELLMGRTPFHSVDMKELIARINRGNYKLYLKEPVSIECALFLTQCLQADENNRISVD